MDSLRWTVRIKKSAKKELADIDDRGARNTIFQKIAELGNDPFPHGCRKLEGRQNTWRI